MSGGYRRCQVLNCADRTSSRHRFPNPHLNRNRFNEWIRLCGNLKLVNMDPDLIFQSHRVCHQYFTSQDITSVPSQRMPKPLGNISQKGVYPVTSCFDVLIAQPIFDNTIKPVSLPKLMYQVIKFNKIPKTRAPRWAPKFVTC
ncbi:hypothetical protein RI129_002931 [Pyrocoelia pectoralis]|uniref:THAP-type domain-containing protein n=1 Tax=Pyrocoelia pectoralis TaxID=417401 RepID=A0AAN7VME9_9COLE